jgi:hypothetical protein
MGWISGVIILIFMVLYACYVTTSYLLAKKNKKVPPKATFNFDNCNGTVDNLDFDNKLLISSSKNNLDQRKDTGVNFISVDRNSLTPNIKIK